MDTSLEKTKLLVAISDFRIGGAQKVVLDIISRIDVQKFNITLLTFFEPGSQENFYEALPSHVKVYRLNFSGFFDFSNFVRIATLLYREKYDVVWSHLYFSNTYVRLFQSIFRYRVVTVEHNTYINRSRMQRFVDRILSFFTYRIVAVAGYVQEYMSRTEKISLSKFSVIHNGVDVDEIAKKVAETNIHKIKNELGFSDDTELFINVGQLIKQKNQTLLIEAFSNFLPKASDYGLVILGEGPEREKLESMIADKGLQERVKLIGIKKNVPEYLAASRAFVLTSVFEGFPIVAIEALAAGLPIISTPVSASDLYVSNSTNGYISNPEALELCSKMVEIKNLSQSQHEAFRASSKELAKNFSIDLVTKKYESLFLER